MPGVDLAAGVVRELADELDAHLAAEDAALAARFPGARAGRQPVHTVYVPADTYDSDLPAAWGAQALQAMDAHGDVLRECLGSAWSDLMPLVVDKLGREPIEDLRLDFEDGYGTRPDDVEDADVARAATALAAAQQTPVACRRPASGSRASSSPRAGAASPRSPASSTRCCGPVVTSTASWRPCRR